VGRLWREWGYSRSTRRPLVMSRTSPDQSASARQSPSTSGWPARGSLGFRDLLAAAGDSCRHLPTLNGDLLERAPVAVERGLLAAKRLPPLNSYVHVLRVEFQAATDAPRVCARQQVGGRLLGLPRLLAGRSGRARRARMTMPARIACPAPLPAARRNRACRFRRTSRPRRGGRRPCNLFAPEMAKNSPIATRTSRMAYCSKPLLPSSANWTKNPSRPSIEGKRCNDTRCHTDLSGNRANRT
jgi:hypothetical protein